MSGRWSRPHLVSGGGNELWGAVRQRPRVVISDWEFAPAKGAWDTFMDLPRGAVVNSLKNKDNKIEVDFVLEGDLDNPHFALNEAFVTRVAVATAERLGVSIREVVEGLVAWNARALKRRVRRP